jgi:hypothetical protein
MRDIDLKSYGPAAQELISRAQTAGLPGALTNGTPVADAQPALRAMTDQTISQNRRVRMPHDAQALHAGLWLLFDYFTESHEIAQSIATPSGSYWHAILHRREPVPSNAKYWFQRVGEHPVYPELLDDAREIAAAGGDPGKPLLEHLQKLTAWDGAWFVDRCSAGGDSGVVGVLLAIQRREWQLLFDCSYRKAFA